ncbi:hypothetical protein HAX54_014570 [Datura stramonium]|uniref:Uncharacterized protein n=1 Tax=Datura stramonium TaxID=4076 RepID=A0ABS8TR32_DATST|nr:hypothetical protein [Datura stramonium]
MTSPHKLLFEVVHKMMIPREERRTEANYLDLTLMFQEQLASKDFDIAIMCTDHRDAIPLIYGKYAIDQETLKAEIASLKSALDMEKETNQENGRTGMSSLKILGGVISTRCHT